MANILSAKKRARQSVKRAAHALNYKAKIRAAKKKLKTKEELQTLTALIQRVAEKGIIHPNKAAHLISKLSKKISSPALASAAKAAPLR